MTLSVVDDPSVRERQNIHADGLLEGSQVPSGPSSQLAPSLRTRRSSRSVIGTHPRTGAGAVRSFHASKAPELLEQDLVVDRPRGGYIRDGLDCTYLSTWSSPLAVTIFVR